jgi:hypothetical protein
MVLAAFFGIVLLSGMAHVASAFPYSVTAPLKAVSGSGSNLTANGAAAGSNATVYFLNSNVLLTAYSLNTVPAGANITITNVTGNSTLSGLVPANVSAFILLNVTITRASSAAFNVTLAAGDGCGSSAVPYLLLANGTWTALSYTINISACTLAFNMPADSTAGLFSSASSSSSSGNNAVKTPSSMFPGPITTVAPVTTVEPAPATAAPQTPSSGSNYLLAAIVLIVIAALALVYSRIAGRGTWRGHKRSKAK